MAAEELLAAGTTLRRAPPSSSSVTSCSDGDREFDYETGAEESLPRAADRGWTVISVKDDWATVFADI